MKRITVAYPFEDVRGKLAGKQELEYAENNNPAFDAPAGRQYARNYKACMIACKRSATGKTYFQIKTKTATKVNAGSKLRMALLGGTGACRAAILTDATKRGLIENIYAAAKVEGRTSAKTVEKYVYDVVYEGLRAKSVMFSFFSTNGGSLTIQNPWVYTNQQGGQPITIKTDILVKFWGQLAVNGITYTVDGNKGIARSGDEFNQNYFTGRLNVLSLDEATVVDHGPCVVVKNWTGGQVPDMLQVLTFNGAPIEVDTEIVAQAYEVVEMQHES